MEVTCRRGLINNLPLIQGKGIKGIGLLKRGFASL